MTFFLKNNAFFLYLANRQVVINKSNEMPAFDGMTIDAEGFLWVAVFGGFRVIRIDPWYLLWLFIRFFLFTLFYYRKKRVDKEIYLPAAQITSVMFGGENLETLFVTSVASAPNEQPYPVGSLFKITGLGVKGLPMHNAKLL